MYNVENINEKNLFVVKKDNAVKRLSNYEETSDYIPAGTFVHLSYVSNKDITDAMLESAKEKGARKVYSGVIFPQENNEAYPEITHVRPYKLRRATKEEVAQCIKYAQEYNNSLEERNRKQQEEYEKECAKHKAEQERKARELDEFKQSLKGKWTKFVADVMRKCAVELLFLAGKCNKKQMANNKLLGDWTRRYHLPEDIFEKKYGMTIDEYEKKRKEFISSGHSGRETLKWERKIFGEYGVCGSMGMLFDVLGLYEK